MKSLSICGYRQLCTKLSHIDYESKFPKMVDISHKGSTNRYAHARAIIKLPINIANELSIISHNNTANNEINTVKGPVFATAIIAGTFGAKKTSELIPFCHPLPIEKCDFDIVMLPFDAVSKLSTKRVDEQSMSQNFMSIRIDCKISTSNKTGVEMEALTGVTIASLTIYDMLKAMSHEIEIVSVKLIEKKGGKSDYLIKDEKI